MHIPGKRLAHGVDHHDVSLLGRDVVVLDDEGPVAQELVLQELVRYKPHAQDDEEIQLLAAEEPKGVRVVFVV